MLSLKPFFGTGFKYLRHVLTYTCFVRHIEHITFTYISLDPSPLCPAATSQTKSQKKNAGGGATRTVPSERHFSPRLYLDCEPAEAHNSRSDLILRPVNSQGNYSTATPAVMRCCNACNMQVTAWQHMFFRSCHLPTSISALAWVYNYEKLRDTFHIPFDRQDPSAS